MEWRHAAGLVLLCAVLYGSTLSFGFVWDDVPFIRENQVIQSLGNIPRMFYSNLWAGTDLEHSNYYRPLPTVLSAVDHSLWGKNPFGYHLTNILLHAVVTVMAYLLAIRYLGAPWPGFCAAVLFALHPVQAETVSWIGARTEMLPALFMFAALYAHIRFLDGKRRVWLAAGLLSFSAALLSKEMAVTLPALVMLTGALRKEPWRSNVRWGFCYGLILIPYFVIRELVLGGQGLARQPLVERFSTSAGLYVDYFRQLVFPVPAHVCYDVAIKNTFLDPAVLLAALAVAAVIVAASVLWRYERTAAFGIFWVVVTLLPVSGLPTIIRPFAMANRYLYIPSLGIALAGAALSSRAWNGVLSHRYRLMTAACGGLLVCAMGLLTYSRLHYWSNDMEFYAKCVADAPNYGVAQGNFGGILIRQNRLPEAASHLELAYRLAPDNLNIINNLSYVLMLTGDYSRAGVLLDRALQTNPRSYLTRFNAGTLYSLQGRPLDAVNEFLAASLLAPLKPEPCIRLGSIYLQQGAYDSAVEQFGKALERNPSDKAAVYVGLGAAYQAKGELAAAETAFTRALAIRPNDQAARQALGDLRSKMQTRQLR